MSSVVISGDTSGSVTLQAPAVAGTTVLTLPATSGTVITGPGGVTSVASGGTGANTLTANNVILGNGTSAVTFVAPGSTGNVLTSNGTTWTSAAASGGQIQTELFTAPGTWTKPASCTQVRVTVIGGGAGGTPAAAPSVTNPGSTSSFGPAVSATGGTGSPSAPLQFPGNGTVSVGTALKTGSIQMNTAIPAASATAIIGGFITSLGGGIAGATTRGGALSPAALVYSTSSLFMAGSQGNNGGLGGLAIAIVPVSAPVTVTVGAGGAGGSSGTAQQVGTGGTGGAVLVEFIG